MIFFNQLPSKAITQGWKRIQEGSFSCRSKSSSSAIPSRDDLLEEAASLTRSLYRRCLRSVKVIRPGNEFDDLEFARREEEFLNPKRSGGGGILSMSPPPNKEDELRSRAEYYHSYAREYFTQESDCLDNDPLKERDIKRYLYYLRKGEKDRKWLLGDMMFPDPYKDTVDQERIDKFERMSRRYLGLEEVSSGVTSAEGKSSNDETTRQKNIANDGFGEDEDPEWFQKKFPHLR
ncbi:hypothetical protein IV203_020849 [Nitzschia inconspicua]|uniref:Uncharacterized protein n=1 Tax=Nitzschia inconspicua TaxID=303405 RepID=A0A9K3KFQ2_9STRA|nr:hypothetical protein IV203_020849 [Nitzschia inconspicua]